MALINDTKAILADLIAFQTISVDGNLEMIAYIANCLQGVGARVAIYHDETATKANIFATLGPEGDGGIVLSGHTDVVPVADQAWTSDPFEMREEDGLLYGRGTCDMKGFIAACLAMAPAFAAMNLSRPLHFAFTYDEETGCIGATKLAQVLQDQGLAPAVAIIGEPTMMKIIEGHKGCYEYSTVFSGLEGHGSMPDRGVNAVEYAVRYVTRLMELGEELKGMAPKGSPFNPPWTTVQVGKLAGGHTNNVIPGYCEVAWEMRPVRASDADFVKNNLRIYCDEVLIPRMKAVSPDAGIEMTTIGEVVGLEPTSDNEARRIVSELTGVTEAEVVAFGTEAGIFQGIGMSVVVCGPGSINQAHKPDEYIAIEQLERCLDMLTRLGGTMEAA